jgi:hypothetical protein
MMTEGLREPREVHTLQETRREHALGRLAALNNVYWVYLCTAATGTGKTYADTYVVSHLNESGGGRSLTLVPDHKHCEEVVTMRALAEVDSVAFPLLCEETCVRFDEAEAVLAMGLSATAALCPSCPHRRCCDYKIQYDAAKAADHAVATHARGKVMLEVLANRRYISIHERPLDLLRPNYTVNRGLKTVADVAEQAAYMATDPRDRPFYRNLEGVARYLHGQFLGSNEECAVPLPRASRHEPPDVHAALYAAAREDEQRPPPAEAMKLALAAALGRLDSIDVSVEEIRVKGGGVKLVRTITGIGQTDLPTSSTIVFSDATGQAEEYRAILGRPVRDITPRGRLRRVHAVVQVVPGRDVTRKTGVARAGALVHGVLHDLSHKRVGLITHSTLHAKVVQWLAKNGVDTSRLSKVSYFGNESRGSNEWIGACDLIIILGTPRVPPSAIRKHLRLLGKREAAWLTATQAGWHWATWAGHTEAGEEVAVRTGRYRDRDWHSAHLSLVRGELLQAIGRGRGLLPEGIPVYAVTTEDLGDPTIPIAARGYAPLTPRQAAALAALDGTHEGRTLKTRAVAARLGVKKDRAYKILKQLEADDRVKRRGERGGWYLPPRPAAANYAYSPLRRDILGNCTHKSGGPAGGLSPELFAEGGAE